MTFFDLKYPTENNAWVATLGRHPEQRFDPVTEAEDFSEHKRVSLYLESWQPREDWKPAPVCLHFKARGQKLHKLDRIFNGVVGPFISENAVEKMRPFLERQGHVLPLDVVNSDQKFYLWWLPWVEESVDLALSEKFPDGSGIKKLVIDAQKVSDLTAFRTHYSGMYNPSAQGKVLVSDEFRSAWHDADLTGICFVQI
ncbi:MAG: hypothetical protein Q4G36_07555 [Paracoccus sp. (in: a-proteobacteria)]|nr:hypothetical protein [Paracoccus sp. (in: a-proteobacteria)]